MDDNSKKLSQDEMIKNLIRDYPADALQFFYPEIIEKYGRPVRIDFQIQEIKKHSHYDKNLKNDIAVIYEFENGNNIVLALIEHWSDKFHFDIHRFAHYLIDLDMQYPDYEKLPVALFTDKNEAWKKKPPLEIRIKCLDESFLCFRYRLIRMKEYEAERYRNTKNKFIAVLRSSMKWDKNRKIMLAVDFIKMYALLEEDIKNAIKNLDIIEYFLYLTDEEKQKVAEIFEKNWDSKMSIAQELIKRGEAKGLQEGIIKGKMEGKLEGKMEGKLEGKIEGKLEAARGMFRKGLPVNDILEITGLSRDDLARAGLIKK